MTNRLAAIAPKAPTSERFVLAREFNHEHHQFLTPANNSDIARARAPFASRSCSAAQILIANFMQPPSTLRALSAAAAAHERAERTQSIDNKLKGLI